MGIRTNWHEDAATGGPTGFDPFDMSSSGAMAAAPLSGAPLSIDLSVDELTRRLRSLFKREGNLFSEGITCSIKDNPEGTCLGCPLNEMAGDSAKGALCKIGCEQERVQTMLLAKNARPNR